MMDMVIGLLGILIVIIIALIAHLNIRKTIKEADNIITNTIYYCNQYCGSPNWFGVQETISNGGIKTTKSSHLKEKDWLGETLGDRAKEAMYALDEFNLFYIKHKYILSSYSELLKDIYDTCENLIFSRASHKYTWNNVGEFGKKYTKDIEKLKKYQDSIIKPNPNWAQKILIYVPTRAYRSLNSKIIASQTKYK